MKNIINSHTDTSTTARILKRVFFYTLTAFLISTTTATAEEWTYDFGTEHKVHDDGISTDFLPAPAENGGTAKVSIGTGGGAIYLNNNGTYLDGSGSELQLKAAVKTSYNIFSIYGYKPGEVARISFKMRLGDESGGNTATNGAVHFCVGNDLSGNSYDYNNTFSGLKWTFEDLGLAKVERHEDSWKASGITKFDQGENYFLEIFANNSLNPQDYTLNGTDYTLASGTWDLWVDGVRYDAIAKSRLDTGTPLDSFHFFAGSSAENVANIFLDDFFYSNVLDPGQPFITPSSARYNLDFPDDVSTTFTLNSAKNIVAISHGSVNLVEGTDYTITGDNLTIKNSFLATELKKDEDTVNLKLNFKDASSGQWEIPFLINAYLPLQTGENWVKNWNFEEWDDDDNPKLWDGTTKTRYVKSDSGQGMVGNYALKWTPAASNNSLWQYGMEFEKREELHLEVFVKGTGILNLTFKNPHTGGFRPNETGVEFVVSDENNWQKFSMKNTPASPGIGDDGGPRIRAKYASDGDVLYVGAVWFSNTPSPTGWPFAGLDPVSLIFDLSQPADVESIITWNGSAQITSIKKGSETLLLGQDFRLDDIDGSTMKLTITQLFLANALPASPASVDLIVAFDIGDPVTLTIKTGNPPEISQTDFSFNVDRADDIRTTITLNDADDVTSIDLSGNPIGNSNYTIGDKVDGSSSLTINNSYLKGLLKNAGDFYVLTVNFDNGGQPPIDLTITAVEAGLNLVTNEFFSSWLGGHPEDWNVDVTIEESSDGLYGPSSAKLKATAKTDKTLTQYGKSMVANKT